MKERRTETNRLRLLKLAEAHRFVSFTPSCTAKRCLLPDLLQTGSGLEKNVEITGNEAFCLSTTTFAEAPLNRLLGLLQPPERSGDVPPVREVRRGLPKAAGFVDGSLLTWRRR